MRNKSLIILVLTLFAAFPSCKKAPLSIGKIVTETRELPDFNEVHLNDNISLSLVRSDTCYIIITTGENLIGNITSEVKNNTLTLCNTNILEWIRSYDYELHATLYYKDITKFIFSSSGTLDTKNQYNDPDFNGLYWFEVEGGSGDVDILLNDCQKLHFLYHGGNSIVTMHGSGNKHLEIDKHSYGIIDARDLQTQYVDIINRSVGDCYIWVTDCLKAKIIRFGNIYYKGEPDSISVTYGEYAHGRLIPLY